MIPANDGDRRTERVAIYDVAMRRVAFKIDPVPVIAKIDQLPQFRPSTIRVSVPWRRFAPLLHAEAEDVSGRRRFQPDTRPEFA